MMKSNLLVIGNPHCNQSAKAFLNKFTKIMDGIDCNYVIVSGDKPDTAKINWKCISGIRLSKNPIKICFYYFMAQIKILIKILFMKHSYDNVVLFPTLFFIVAFFLKLKNKRIILIVTGVPQQKVLRAFGRINFLIADVLVVESGNVANEWGIEKYDSKIEFGGIYVDQTIFKKEINIECRSKIVGFVGRLSKDKGVIEFIESIKILSCLENTSFLIIGDGEHRELVENYIKREGLSNIVQLVGWVNNDSLPSYLNKLKLLVIPSRAEGIPNIILESMACGTPVLASKVGGIPDVIDDQYNGFLIEEISAKSISDYVNEILILNLEKISKSSIATVNKNFTFLKAVERWKNILRV